MGEVHAMIWPIAFFAGVISFVSPCIIPMLSVYFSLILGTDIKAVESHSNLRPVLIRRTVWFVLGFGLIFALAGGTAGRLVALLDKYQATYTLVGGLLVIVLGISIVLGSGGGPLKRLPHLNLRLASRYPSLNAFLTGNVFAVACSHCIAPTLLTMLVYVGTQGSPSRGMAIMAVFSLGLGVSYLLAAAMLAEAKGLLRWLNARRRAVEVVSGSIVTAMGLLVLTGRFTDIAAFLYRLIPFKLPFGM